MKYPKLAATVLAAALIATTGTAATAAPSNTAARSITTAKTQDHRTGGAIGQLYNGNRELRNQLGTSTGPEEPAGTGKSQRFEHGTIYWSPAWGAHATINGDIQARFIEGGGPTGDLGFPTTSKYRFAGGWVQGFSKADVTWGPGVGAKVIGHGMYSKWATDPGRLGWPTHDETPAGPNAARQDFERGSMIWSSTYGAHPAQGAIGNRWQAAGGQNSPHGNPATDEIGGWRNGGIFQAFNHGWIYYSPATGAHSVWGAIGAFWAQTGREGGYLGYPITEEISTGNGVFQRFENGTIFHSPNTGTHATTPGGIEARFNAGAGAAGELGFPTTEKVPYAGGYVQTFANADIIWGPETGAKVLGHGIYQKWVNNPGQFGWPLTEERSDTRGIHVRFQKKEVIWNPTTGLHSAEPVDSSTVIFLGDSQLGGTGLDSWGELAAQKLGLTHQIEHAFGGLGYVSTNLHAGGSAEQALAHDRVLLPQGNPGAIILTLGGNDAAIGASDAAILAAANNTWDTLTRKYPNTKIIINGVMSRTDPSHTRRRHVDALITNAAKARGLQTISAAGLATTAGADKDYQDNVHLTQEGHNKTSAAYLPLLKEALKTR